MHQIPPQYKPKDPDYAQKVRESFSRQGFMSFIGAELVDIHPGYCMIRLPYREALTQQHGFFHAGVIGTIADNCGGYAAYSLMAPDSSVLSVEFKLNLLRPGDGDTLTGRGYVVKAGRHLTVCRTEITIAKKDQEKLCATSLMTLMEMSEMPDTVG